jgi:membrane protease YdiL (CAAX protease family)
MFTLQVFVLPLVRALFNDGEPFASSTLEINIQRMMNGVVGVGLVYIFLNFDRQTLKAIGFTWHQIEIIILHELLDILGIFLTLLVTVLAIGVGEELLFRGYLQRIFETRYSFQNSALMSAFLFGLLHFLLATTSRSIYYMVAILFSALVIGLMLSYTYQQTGYNLIFPIAIHGFWDFFLFIFQAEFVYSDWFIVIMEISASTIGAVVILLLVQYYIDNYQNLSEVTT